MPDTDKQTASAKNPTQPDAAKKNALRKKSKTSGLGLSLIALFFALAAYAGLYYLWQQLNDTNQQLLNRNQEFFQQQQDIKQEQLDLTAQQKQQFATLSSAQEKLRHNLTNLIRNNEHLRNDWLMAEAEYLIKLANHRLLLEKDTITAAVALRGADARLAEVADPALLSVRKILLHDIQALDNVPKLDVAGLSVTLNALSDNIPSLPLRIADPKSHQQLKDSADKQPSKQVNNIQNLPAAIWQDLKNLIVIRNHQKAIKPLLAPEQLFFLKQNLALYLEQSRLALLNGQNEIYQERLQTAQKWIKQFFDEEHNVTRNMLAQIEELRQYDIDPALPDISSTYSAIQKYRLRGDTPLDDADKGTK